MIRPHFFVALVAVCVATPIQAQDPLPQGARLRLGTEAFRASASTIWGFGTILPDGSGLLCTSTFQLMEFAGGKASSFPKPEAVQGLVERVNFSADGKRYVASANGKYRVCETGSGKQLFETPKGSDFYEVALLSADGSKLAVSRVKKGVVYDVATGKAGPELLFDKIWLPTIAFSPDGKLLAAYGSQDFKSVVRIFDTADGKELVYSKGPSDPRSPPAFSPDGKVIALEGSESVWLLDAVSGKGIRQIEVLKSRGHILRFSADGKVLLVVSSEKGEAEWIETATGKVVKTTSSPVQFPITIRDAVFTSPERAIVWGDQGRAAYAWEVPSGKALIASAGHRDSIKSVVYSSDGKEIVTTAQDGGVLRWNASTGSSLGETAMERVNQEFQFQLTLAPDAKCAFSSAAVYDLNTGQTVVKWPEEVKKAASQFSLLYPAAKAPRVAVLGLSYSTGNPRVIVCDTETGKVLMNDSVPVDLVNIGARASAAMSPDGKRVVVSVCSKYIFGKPQSSDIRAWNVADGKKLFEANVDGSRGDEGAVVVSPDGKTIYVASNYNEPMAIEMETGKIIRHYGDRAKVKSSSHPVVSPDGKLLAIRVCPSVAGLEANEFTIHIYDTATEKLLHTIAPQGLLPMTFSPDSKTLVTKVNQTVLLWDLADLK